MNSATGTIVVSLMIESTCDLKQNVKITIFSYIKHVRSIHNDDLDVHKYSNYCEHLTFCVTCITVDEIRLETRCIAGQKNKN